MELCGVARAARTTVCVLILVMASLRAEEPLSIGGGTTESRNQSKLWHHACSWWSVLPDGGDNSLYRWDGNAWEAQFVVDTRLSARADCLANGDDLFVLMGHHTQSRLYKYAYDHVEKTYDAVAGFPITLPLGASGLRASMAQDSTGKLWVTYLDGSKVKVVWSTSADHDTWDATGRIVGSGIIAADDLSSVIAFQGDRIGVFYSNSEDNAYYFAVHRDEDGEQTWQTTETAATGTALGDDHVSLAKSTDGDVFAAIKDKLNRVYLVHRDPDAGWDAPIRTDYEGTRPHLVYDRFANELYYLYTLNDPEPARLMVKKAPLGDLASLETATAMVFVEVAGQRINDVTTTKQFVDDRTGLLGTASGGGLAYTTWLPIGDGGPGSNLAARVNFQPAGADAPDGYAVDNGSTFDAGRGYGWSDRLKTKERGFQADQRRDTYVYVANSDGPVDWEYELPDGAYTVTLVAGSPVFTGRQHVEIEGTTVIDDVFTRQDFVEVSEHRVTVADGRLTITIGDPAIGSKKTKLCYIEITGVGGSCFRSLSATALASTLSGAAPLTVDFTGEAVSPNSTIDSVSWDFGDGATSTEDDPAHTFASPGVYDVVFTATDTDGNTAEFVVTIEVSGRVTVTASADNVRGPAPLAVGFTATATSPNGAVTLWSWAFGDGATATVQNPAHAYTAPGTYVASVQATDVTGQSALADVTITVLGLPSATAALATDTGDAPFNAAFTGAASSPNGPIVTWAWAFGDGNTSNEQSPTHTYTNPGPYTATLVATDTDGQTAIDSVNVTVNEPVPEPPPEEDPPATGVVARINFQPNNAAVPADYEMDTGASFDAGRGYGWSKGLPNKRRATHPDARLDTYVYVSNTAGPVDWEYALSNGTYYVTVVAGSPAWSGIHHVALEGATVIDTVATSRSHVEVKDYTVVVTDGRLTMTIGDPAIGRKKSKVCFLEIRRAN